MAISGNCIAQKAGNLSAEDYVEILQLYFQYPLILDSGDGEAFADLFTEDGWKFKSRNNGNAYLRNENATKFQDMN